LAPWALLGACGSGSGAVDPPAPSPALSTISLGRSSDLPADGAAAAEVGVVLRDTTGAIVAGAPLRIEVSGTGNLVSPPAGVVTAADGSAAFAIRSTRAETKVVQVRVSGSGSGVLLSTHEVVFVATAPVPDRCAVTAEEGYAAADGSEPVTVTVVLRDRHDNPVPGLRVELSSASPGASLRQPEVATGSDGAVQGMVACDRAGVIRVGARVATSTGTIALPAADVRFADRPRLAHVAVYADVDRDGRCDEGDTLAVPFTEAIVLTSPIAAAELFSLPVEGDALGTGATVSSGHLADRLVVRLGTGARLRARGQYDAGRRFGDAASGIDLAGGPSPLASASTGVGAAASTPADVFADFVPAAAVLDLRARVATTADVDGDGQVDLVLGADDGTVQVWHGRRGLGLSRPMTLFWIGEAVTAVAVADFDRDGHADLAAAGAERALWLRRGHGGDRFDAPMLLSARGGTGLVAGDFDGDGSVDLVHADNDGRCWVVVCKGEPTLVRALDFGGSVAALAAGDLDLDGDLDLAVAGARGGVSLFANHRQLAFALAHSSAVADPTALALVDLDRDGDLDVLCAGSRGVDVLRNERARGFTADLPLAAGPTSALAVLDLDGDGSVDLLTGGAAGGLWRNLNPGFAGLPSGIGTEGVVAAPAADFDRDGDLDLVLLRREANPMWCTGSASAVRGPMQLEPAAAFVLGSNANAQVLADVDRDGDLDVVIGLPGGGGRVLRNERGGVLSDSGEVLGGVDFTLALAVGDLDQDGDLDVITGNTAGGGAWIYLNDGAGHFLETAQVAAGAHTTALALGDVDRDGDLDLVVGNLGVRGESNRLFTNDGHGRLRDTGLRFGSLETRSLLLADVDGDGDLDLITADARGEALLWLGDGRGGFAAAGACLRQGRLSGLAGGDLDGDGDLDLWAASDDGTGSRVWRNDGRGAFTDSGQRLGLLHATSVRLADVDGDGDPDAVTTALGVPPTLWSNDGAGTFAAADLVLPAGNTIALGDLDLDGEVDLVLSDGNGRVQVLRRR